MTSLTSNNTDWGFWGSIARSTGLPKTAVRDFLDSRHGRHFAGEVANHLAASRDLETAIGAATDTWMGWRIGRLMARETGIPQGLPYVTGLVGHMQVEADAAA